MPYTKKLLLISALAVCGLIAAYGGASGLAFDTTPGAPALAPSRWPVQSGLRHSPRHSQLLMFIHPQCTCSIASLDQLRLLQKEIGPETEMHVVLWRGTAASGSQDWRRAIGKADLFEDRDGSQSRLFGIKTSGQTLLYDQSGHLQFAGGLTVLRGEAGGKPILTPLLRRLNSNHPSVLEKPVFGCPLAEPVQSPRSL